MSYEKQYQAVEKYKDMILEAERHIWKNPEPGYREWKTHAYLKEKYEAFGYKLVEAGNIPGFYTDIDTGIATVFHFIYPALVMILGMVFLKSKLRR